MKLDTKMQGTQHTNTVDELNHCPNFKMRWRETDEGHSMMQV